MEKRINDFEKNALEGFDKSLTIHQNDNDEALYFLKSYHAYINFVTTELRNNFDEGDALFISRLATDILAIYACLNHGVKNQSFLIIRSLVESSVMYEFINTDRNVLMPLYLEHEHYLRGKKLKETTDKSDLPPWLDINQINFEYQRVEKNYVGSYWYTKYLKDTKGITHPKIFHLFKLTKREEEYRYVYNTFSNFSHGSSITHQAFQSKNGYTTTFSFDKKEIFRYALLTLASADKTIAQLPARTQEEKDIISYSKKYMTLLGALEIDY
ncbi:hypothetical protein EH196_06985 [Bacillus sp. C1-1]|nr:hypothetical protein EH196_06985 [Bacillus sp. C1-1]